MRKKHDLVKSKEIIILYVPVNMTYFYFSVKKSMKYFYIKYPFNFKIIILLLMK